MLRRCKSATNLPVANLTRTNLVTRNFSAEKSTSSDKWKEDLELGPDLKDFIAGMI